MIAEWSDPPPMDMRAPQPYLVTSNGTAWVAYRTDRGDHFAVLRFRDVQRLTFGELDDEHPKPHSELRPSHFHLLTDPALERDGLRRWVATFPDETLDIVALQADVMVRAIFAADSRSALGMILA